MSSFLIHAAYALIFCLVFAIGTFIWDLDHLVKCRSSLVGKAITNQYDMEYVKENLDQNGCRGFFHSFEFIIIFTALYLAFVIHMIMDNGLIKI